MYDESVQCFNIIIEIDPKYIEAYFKKGYYIF